MEEELQNDRVGGREILLKGVDTVIAILPHLLGRQFVDPHDQHVLVIGAIKDPDQSLSGGDLMSAPEKIMSQFLVRGHFKGFDAAALRVNGGEHMADRSVLAGGVHSLEHDQDAMGAGGVHFFLNTLQLRQQLGQLRLSLLFAQAFGPSGGDFAEFQLFFIFNLDGEGHGEIS